jgi:hypothetical protein
LRKIAAILLICLLLFNWYGYRFITNYLQKKADSQLEARLDVNDYDESQLIEIRVELNIPYQYSWSNFERHSGEIELNGKIYAYVKRKVEDGYLVLKCIPNSVKEEIKKAGNNLFSANNGLDQEHNGKTPSSPKIFKSFSGDYDDHSYSYNLKALNSFNRNPLKTSDSFFTSITLPVVEQPPENSLFSLI